MSNDLGTSVQLMCTVNVDLIYMRIQSLQVPTVSYFSIWVNSARFNPFNIICIRLRMSLLYIKQPHGNPQIRYRIKFWFSMSNYGW